MEVISNWLKGKLFVEFFKNIMGDKKDIMRKRRALLGGVVLSALILMSFAGCSFWETEIYTTVDGMDYRRWYPNDNRDYYASSDYSDATNKVREYYFIAREIRGYPVKELGVVPFMASTSDPICREGNGKINNVYCPGSIERCEEKYFNTYYANDTEQLFYIYYCGTVIDLSKAGYGEAIVYYVPSAQLEAYCALWQENREGAICAANIEYLLNAEGMEEYYYIDYVAEGETIENIPPEPTRKGYEFMGWFTDETGTQEYNFSKPINAEEQKSLKLFAKWQKK